MDISRAAQTGNVVLARSSVLGCHELNLSVAELKPPLDIISCIANNVRAIRVLCE